MIAGYIGKSDVFDREVAPFSKDYADQGEHDYYAFRKAIRQGRMKLNPTESPQL